MQYFDIKNKKLRNIQLNCYFCPPIKRIAVLVALTDKIKKGGLAHLARALAWQARGDRFESGILHKNYEGTLKLIIAQSVP